MFIIGSMIFIIIFIVGLVSGKKVIFGIVFGQDGIFVDDYSQYNQDLLLDIIG